jgi:hypothetical protein
MGPPWVHRGQSPFKRYGVTGVMMAGGVVSETISVRAGGGDTAERVLRITQRHGMAGVLPVGPRTYRLTRSYRPTWATVAGCVTAPTVLGLGFLMVRHIEHCTLSIGRERGATLVRLDGHLPGGVVEELRAELSSPAENEGFDDGPTARLGRPSLRTVLRRVVEFDTGERATIGGLVLVGRRPAAKPGEHLARLVAIKDPTRSVSKTHLAMGEDDHGVWVVDRHSTNGTTVVPPIGRLRDCMPGERVYLAPGSRVMFGERSFAVREAHGVDASASPR